MLRIHFKAISSKEIDHEYKRTNIGMGFWLAWVLASIMGFGMGAILGVSVAYGPFDSDGFDATIGITFGIVMGATSGYLQWVVFREKVARAGWWVLASTIGFAIAGSTLGANRISENYVMAGIQFAAVFGVAGGLLQWLVLRRAGIARAGLWVLASVIGSLVGAIGFPISSAIGAAGNYGLSAMAYGLFPGAGLGAIPGAALAVLHKKLENEILLTRHDTVQINPSSPVWVDALQFQSITTSSPEDAINLYQGDLLSDFYDDWILEEREHYRT
jgi:hypothetical protein